MAEKTAEEAHLIACACSYRLCILHDWDEDVKEYWLKELCEAVDVLNKVREEGE
ncbi:MAG TPA: hypothetical protein VHK86_00050 [Nitrososphaera sp.]|jgi:hypothetical protein|nr:hypothetical protein [Nitrososphaera sp.]